MWDECASQENSDPSTLNPERVEGDADRDFGRHWPFPQCEALDIERALFVGVQGPSYFSICRFV